MYSLRILNSSRKLCNSQNVMLYEPAVVGRFFSKDTGNDLSRTCQHSSLPENRDLSFSAAGGIPNTVHNFDHNHKSKEFIWLGKSRGKLSGTKNDISAAELVFNRGFSGVTRSIGRSFSTDSGLPPHQEIGMPSLSPTMTEGNIARWLKKEGDKVSPGEVLCEVETDKATVEMECMDEGYIAKIIHGDGAKDIKVGEVIVITVEEEDDIPKFKDYKGSTPAAVDASPKESSDSTLPVEDVSEPSSPAEPKIAKEREPLQADDRVFVSPLARKLAEERNVSLSNIEGTGPEGRIVKADIEDYLGFFLNPRFHYQEGFESSDQIRLGVTKVIERLAPNVPFAIEATRASGAKADPTAKSKVATAEQTLDYSSLPLSQIRKVIASRLLLSKQTIPHYYLTVDTRVDKLMDLRAQLNSLQEASSGKRISVNDFVIKAAALALVKVPQCNGSWANEYIRQYHHVNINVAVQTENGLFVPVIRDADKKGLSAIAEEVKHLAQKAKDNSLKPEDYEGGTFTISNLGGPFGVKQFCAIVNPPQAGILAVGSAEKRVIPGAGSNQFDVASLMSVTLSCDHRVIDGAIGAEWLKAFKGYIENPMSMLL